MASRLDCPPWRKRSANCSHSVFLFAYNSLVTHFLSQLSPQSQRLLAQIAQVAREREVVVYLVGGVVRDLLLGLGSADLDIAIVGDAIAFAHAVAEKWGGAVVAHTRFGTATWRETADALPIDLITARSEQYASPAALPTVTASSMAADLARRDFTINALAWELTATHIVDLHHGQDDLANGIIRVLHEQSFVDDPTRIFRAIRYAQRLGFEIEPHTKRWLMAGIDGIARLSGDRVRHELAHILRERRGAAMLAQLAEWGVLAAITPQLRWQSAWEKGVFADDRDAEKKNEAIWWRWWLAHLPGWETVGARLNLSAALLDDVAAIYAMRDQLAHLSDLKADTKASTIERRLRPYKKQPLARQVVRMLVDGTEAAVYLGQYERLKDVRPFLDGHDLKEMGIAPGPHYRRLLDAAFAAQLDGEADSVAAAKSVVQQLI